ncbi:hypothetical protein [Rhodococcoides kroppenstedtii]|uniref:hypothetical protein n=1 Tax=Rhodococcoides kroppenstedtii TaxID=293050 RepID=UPI0027E21D25|nr:hypothetical protein [Rhodococcus kroppenstedtii]
MTSREAAKTRDTVIDPADRVAGADESYDLAERLFGWTAPIQFAWVLADDPGHDAVLDWATALARGGFGRRIVRTRVPVARHRWVRAERPPTVYAEPTILNDATDTAVGAWLDRRLRDADLDPGAGRGFTVEYAHTRSGRVVLTLLVSHMIADGHAVHDALRDARRSAENRLGSVRGLPTASEVSGWSGVRGDLLDAAAQVPAIVRATAVIGRAGVRALLGRSAAVAPVSDAPSGSDTAARPAPPQRDADTTLAVVDIPREQWESRATALGGTPNSLFTALLTSVLRETGHVMPPGGTRVCIAVDTRSDGDDRANASGGVWIRLAGPVGPATGLATVRRLSKEAFARYAVTDDAVVDHLQAIARLMPDVVLGRLMKAVPGPDVTVSNLGAAPTESVAPLGTPAERFAIRAVMQGRSAADRRAQGPALAAWSVQYADTVTVTVFGIHPDLVGDTASLRATLSSELTRWGLDHRFW